MYCKEGKAVLVIYYLTEIAGIEGGVITLQRNKQIIAGYPRKG